MNAMIQDLVDSARLEAGQLTPNLQQVDMRAFILDLEQRLAPAYDMRRLALEAQEDLPAVLADPDCLERILTNLLSNAYKYSTPGTPITIRVRRQADWVVT